MFTVTPERPADAADIENLLDQAFGADRHARPSYQFRTGLPPIDNLRLVVREGGRIVGTIRYWPILIGEAATPALLLGPLGIAPDRQGVGIGRALMGTSLEQAARDGHRLVLLVGDLGYYGRFGFEPALPHGITMPGDHARRLLLRELTPGALAGVAGEIQRWGRARLNEAAIRRLAAPRTRRRPAATAPSVATPAPASALR
jgi:predicted N-acetyltransferase YhbS